MAIAVNVFRTFTQTVGTMSSIFYTAPSGYTGVVLLSQVTNLGSQTHTMTFNYKRTANGSNIETPIVKDLAIPSSNTANFFLENWLLRVEIVYPFLAVMPQI